VARHRHPHPDLWREIVDHAQHRDAIPLALIAVITATVGVSSTLLLGHTWGALGALAPPVVYLAAHATFPPPARAAMPDPRPQRTTVYGLRDQAGAWLRISLCPEPRTHIRIAKAMGWYPEAASVAIIATRETRTAARTLQREWVSAYQTHTSPAPGRAPKHRAPQPA
jgi:hypothetical protein